MALKPGDKCPTCKEGLLVKTEVGLLCDECGYEIEIEEVMAEAERAKVQAGDYTFKPRTFSITIEDPEQGEIFLRGLIIARQNNSSEYFVDLIDAVNYVLEPWRAARLAQELRVRDSAPA